MKEKQRILKSNVDITSLSKALDVINEWVINSSFGKYICLFNVHMCMEAFDDSKFFNVVNDANLVLPDGFPIYLAQKLLGHSNASKIRGADLTIELVKFSKQNNIPIGFIGGTEKTLKKMNDALKRKYGINTIKYSYSIPFRSLSLNETNDILTSDNETLVNTISSNKIKKFSQISFTSNYDLERDSLNEYKIGYNYFDECFGLNIDFKRNHYADNDLKPTDILTLMFSFKNIGSYQSSNLAVSEKDKQDIKWINNAIDNSLFE